MVYNVIGHVEAPSPLSFLPFTFNSICPSATTIGATLGGMGSSSVASLLTSWVFTSCPVPPAPPVCLETSSQNACSDNLRLRTNAIFSPGFQVLWPQPHTVVCPEQLPSEGQAPHALFGFMVYLAPPTGCHSRNPGVPGLLTIAPQCIAGVQLVLVARKTGLALRSSYPCGFWSKLNSCMERRTDLLLSAAACKIYCTFLNPSSEMEFCPDFLEADY